MEAVKSVLKIILTSIMAGGVLLLFLTFTLPAIQEDRAELVEQEMDAHNQTLEMVKQDFSYVLSDENISADVKKNILLTISGEYCVLKVTLNRELKVISLETVEKIHDRDVGIAFACIGELAVLIFAIVWFCFIIRDIVEDVNIARDRRRAIKNAKKQKVDVEVIV